MKDKTAITVKEDLQKMLNYWMRLWNDEYGAVATVDPSGEISWDENRSAVTMCRSLYGLSVGYHVVKNDEVLITARKIFRCIVDVMLDKTSGGIWAAVDRNGKPCSEEKGTYEQDFLILALTEYYAASGEMEAIEIAAETYQFQQRAKGTGSGYADYYSRDWEEEIAPKIGRNRVPVGGYSIDAQTHTLEAYTNFLRVRRDEAVRDSCIELVDILCNMAYMPQSGRVGGQFSNDWVCSSHRESFGDDAEAGWFSIAAMNLIGDASLKEKYFERALRMINRALESGYNPISESMLNACCGEMVDRDAVWWTMCETANACLVAAEATGNMRYEAVAAALWRFMLKHFLKEDGSWYTKVRQNGEPYCPGEVKGPSLCLYHNTRAICMLYDYLKKTE